MAESNFGIMELLQKLLKERGGAISEKEMGIMSGRKKGATDTGKTGSGYESWLEKNRFDRDKTSNYTPNEMQYLDPLANTTPYNNATTNALTNMRGLQRGEGAVSNNELQNFKIASQYVPDEALGGWLTHKMPMLRQMGVGSFDINLPPNELRNVVDAISTGRFGGVSDHEYEFMVDGMSEGYSFDSQPTEQAIARMRQQQGITANLGGGMDQGAVSDIDARFASRLGAMSDREQAEIISATKGLTTDEQIDNFKRKFLQGRISPYELEMQSNLGF
jgi:hypothetical protein